MSFTNLKEIEKNRSEFTFTIDKQTFDDEIMKVYKKEVKKISVPGFRKGKAPKSIIEKMYGSTFFYDEAIDEILPTLYSTVLDETKLDVVSRPEIDVVSIDENGVTLTAKVFTKPLTVVKNYKGLTAEKPDTLVTDEDINKEIDAVRTRNSRTLNITDRAAELGDEAVIDFEGFLDGIAFEGGKGEKYSLKLGSKSFIPGFEEQLVGKNIGENFNIDVSFPEDYGSKELAGKSAIFEILIHELKKTVLPELDDEFVKEISENLNTVDEYKADVKAKITENKNKANDRVFEENLIDSLLAETEVEIPACMIEAETDTEIRDYEYRLQSQGGSLEMYYKYTGMDEKSFRDSLHDGSERQVKTHLALSSIVESENITPTEDEIEAEYKKIASGYTVEIEKVKETISIESISKDISLRKAIDFVRENAVAIPVAPKSEVADEATESDENIDK